MINENILGECFRYSASPDGLWISPLAPGYVRPRSVPLNRSYCQPRRPTEQGRSRVRLFQAWPFRRESGPALSTLIYSRYEGGSSPPCVTPYCSHGRYPQLRDRVSGGSDVLGRTVEATGVLARTVTGRQVTRTDAFRALTRCRALGSSIPLRKARAGGQRRVLMTTHGVPGR